MARQAVDPTSGEAFTDRIFALENRRFYQGVPEGGAGHRPSRTALRRVEGDGARRDQAVPILPEVLAAGKPVRLELTLEISAPAVCVPWTRSISSTTREFSDENDPQIDRRRFDARRGRGLCGRDRHARTGGTRPRSLRFPCLTPKIDNAAPSPPTSRRRRRRLPPGNGCPRRRPTTDRRLRRRRPPMPEAGRRSAQLSTNRLAQIKKLPASSKTRRSHSSSAR